MDKDKDLRELLTLEGANKIIEHIDLLKHVVDMDNANETERKAIYHYLTQYQIVLRKSKVVVL